MTKIHVYVTKNGKIKQSSVVNSELRTYIGFYITEGLNLVTPVSEYKSLLTEAKKVVWWNISFKKLS